MKLDFIPLDKLVVSKANMRYGKKAPDVSDILPSIRERGILQPLLVRPKEKGRYEVVAGERRLRASQSAALDQVPSVLTPKDQPQVRIPLAQGLPPFMAQRSKLVGVFLYPQHVAFWQCLQDAFDKGRLVTKIRRGIEQRGLGLILKRKEHVAR